MNVRCAFKANNILGEGPVWSTEEQALYWVDIQKPSLQRWDPATEVHTVWQMPALIGSYALREAGGVLVALRTGFAFFDLESHEVTPIYDPEAAWPNTRFNDGKCDRQGRFWAGTMDMGEGDAVGALYRLEPDMRCQMMRSGVTISNGLGWSPDNRTMYYTDSPTHTIFAYDFEPESGHISNERIFAYHKEGYPDGLTVDAEGYIWCARWDGWKVIRFAPDGSIDRVIEMPVQRPTSCIFGGPELRQLYITSASVGLSPAELSQQPLAGSVFVIDSDVEGMPEPKFAG